MITRSHSLCLDQRKVVIQLVLVHDRQALDLTLLFVAKKVPELDCLVAAQVPFEAEEGAWWAAKRPAVLREDGRVRGHAQRSSCTVDTLGVCDLAAVQMNAVSHYSLRRARTYKR